MVILAMVIAQLDLIMGTSVKDLTSLKKMERVRKGVMTTLMSLTIRVILVLLAPAMMACGSTTIDHYRYIVLAQFADQLAIVNIVLLRLDVHAAFRCHSFR